MLRTIKDLLIISGIIAAGFLLSFAHRQAFRDLNKNGKMDPYEDISLPTEQRIDDLMKQMKGDTKD